MSGAITRNGVTRDVQAIVSWLLAIGGGLLAIWLGVRAYSGTVERALAQWQVGKLPDLEPPDVRGPRQQLVAGHPGLRRWLAQGLAQKRRKAHGSPPRVHVRRKPPTGKGTAGAQVR